MELKKNWLYWLAYGWREKEDRPTYESLCTFFWMVIFIGPFWHIMKSLLWFLGAMLGLLMLSLATPLAVLGMGYRPHTFNPIRFLDELGEHGINSEGEFVRKGFVRIKRWPTYEGIHLAPFWVLSVFAILAIITKICFWFFVGTFTEGMTLGRGIMWLILIGLLASLLTRGSFVQLVMAYGRAIKQKICPVVEFK